MKAKAWDRVSLVGGCGVLLASALAIAVSGIKPPELVTSAKHGYVLPADLRVGSALLSDGRTLEVHGADGLAYIISEGSRRAIKLPEARRYASVTVLPAGQVLFWGGVDVHGNVLETGEWFDPGHERFVRTGKLALPARAGHTMTVLADGRLLMAGGWDTDGELAADDIVWDPRSGLTSALVDHGAPRVGAHARLEFDGSVVIDGGVDSMGRPMAGGSRIDSVHGVQANLAQVSTAGSAGPLRVITSPATSAKDVPVTGPLAMRFNMPIKAADFVGHGVTLLGPEGEVPIKVVATNDATQAFVQLPDDLYPGSRYTLFLKGLHDKDGAELPYTAIGFNTAQVVSSSVVMAGQGARPAPRVPGANDQGAPPLYVMAGDIKAYCGESQSLCRSRSYVKDGAFFPGKDNTPDTMGNHWRLYTGSQSLPDTHALESAMPKGATALVGQVRQIDETPVAGVEVSIGGNKVRTDAQGVFMLKELAAGRQEIFVDGASASHGDVKYGRFLVGADVKAGAIAHMPFVMYLPRILPRDEVDLPTPTSRETVLTHPDMPGLELHLPAGAVFKDRDGHVLTHIAIVPTPVDHAPFPLPDNFPMYFTIQPGDAVVQGLTPEAAKGIRVVYPNYGKDKPQTASNFWVYDAKQGWSMYGGGHVTRDGGQIAPDPGVSLVWAMGAGVSTTNANPPTKQVADNKCTGEPIDDQTGTFFHEWNDLAIRDVLPLALTRAYTSADSRAHVFGVGGSSNFSMHLYSADNSFSNLQLVLPCGQGIAFNLVTGGTSWPLTSEIWEHTGTKSRFYGAILQFFTGTPIGEYWLVTLKDGTEYAFQSDAPNQLIWMRDRFGNQITLNYSGGVPEKVISPNGRYITLNYGANNQISSAVDNSGRTVQYAYNSTGTLATVTYPDNTTENYTYDSTNRMLTMQDRRGTVWVTNQYDSGGRVVKQTFADSTFYKFDYTIDVSNAVTATVITAPDGNQERVTFDPVSHYSSTDTRGYGTSIAQTTTFVREPSGLIDSETDILGRTTSYTYDDMGNMTSVTRLSGTAAAVTTSFTYTGTYNQLASITDPLGHTTGLGYTNGCLTSATDALGHSISMQCNSAGQVVSVTDALGNTALAAYQGGDLESVTDPLNRSIHYVTDVLGRRVVTRDPMGNVILRKYDVNDRPVSITDALNQTSSVNYDGNGNVLNIALPNGATNSYTYDLRDRLTKRTDALGQIETWSFDGVGRVLSYTDRKAQVTGFTYDALGRRTLVSYQDGSGIQPSYDAGNRLTELLDTASGNMSWHYDDLDRVTAVNLPQGDVGYTYDAAGRRISMTPANQSQVSYAYDNANRLTNISQGNELVRMGYDAAGRRTTLTLPNGIGISYGYDSASELAGITYVRADGSHLGNLIYSYDADGRRISEGGDFDTQHLPAATTQQASVDLNGRKIGFNGQTLTYDANGNLTSDGTNTYTWNARNQLAQVSQNGSTQLSYAYDALGRRVSKLVQGGAPTQYLYDGVNIVQETQSSTVNPILAGLSVDERFARNDVTGRTYFLTDALNSTIALTDASGTVRQQYSYDPFGNVVVHDTTISTTNPYQYTGRESDSQGLYYYRGRYYSPVMASFISEDPIGFSGGQPSLYAYVKDNPLGLQDPYGLKPGDHYSSADQAAISAISDIVGQSIATDTEYAGVIYHKDDYYSYTAPNRGYKSSSEPGDAPLWTTEVGTYHTHGGDDPTYINNDFSDDDLDNAKQLGEPSYLGTPNGLVKKYIPGESRSDIETIACVSTEVKSDNERFFDRVLDLLRP